MVVKKKQNNFIVPIIAVVVACGISFYMFSFFNTQETIALPEPETIIKEAPTVQILVATKDIYIGKKLGLEDIAWRAWPESLLNPQYITQNEKPDHITNLIGAVVKSPITSGEPIVDGKIIQAGERGAMAVLLRKGMRAVSVPISVTTGAGGFILPGDYVDIIFTSQIIQENLFEPKITLVDNQQQFQITEPVLKNYLKLKSLSQRTTAVSQKDNPQHTELNRSPRAVEVKKRNKNTITIEPKTERKIQKKIMADEFAENNLMKKISKEEELVVTNGQNVSELMLENVRVLAIDQILNPKENKDPAQNQDPNAPPKSTIIGATATLEVTPEQTKLLAWAAAAGTLTLSLRSFSENLSENESPLQNQDIPITKTTFAWPLKNIIEAGNEAGIVEDEAPSRSIELIRNGYTSILRNQNKSKSDATVNSGGSNATN